MDKHTDFVVKLTSIMNSILYSATDARPFNASTGRIDCALRRADAGAGFPFENVDPVDSDEAASYAFVGGPAYPYGSPLTPFGLKQFRATLWRRILSDRETLPFKWYSHSGDRHALEDMATPHLFYALRMVWNHSVPEIWRVGDYIRYSDVSDWPEGYRRRAITALTRELVSRDDDLNEDLRQQFHEIVLKTFTILALGI